KGERKQEQGPIKVRNKPPINLHGFLLRRGPAVYPPAGSEARCISRLLFWPTALPRRRRALRALQYHDGNLRILHRRIGNEPSMTVVKMGGFLVFAVPALHLHYLRGAFLAGVLH